MSNLIEYDELFFLNQIFADLYAEINQERAFRQFLVNLKKIVFFEKGDVYFYHLGNENIKFNTFINVDWNEDDLNSYLYTYCSMDDVLPLIASKQPVMFRSSDVFIKTEREKTQYYNELINPAGMQYSIEGNIYMGDEGYVGGIGIHRSDSYSDFTHKELDILKLARPHLAYVAKSFCDAQTEKNDCFAGIPILKNIKNLGICVWDFELQLLESNLEENLFVSVQYKEELLRSLTTLCRSLHENIIRKGKQIGINEKLMKSKVSIGDKSYFTEISFSEVEGEGKGRFIAAIYDYAMIIDSILHDVYKTYCLTEREYEVLKFVINGFSNQEIGEKLFISIPTVKKHLTSTYHKMGISGKNQIFNIIL